jgi:hypothetical protein
MNSCYKLSKEKNGLAAYYLSFSLICQLNKGIRSLIVQGLEIVARPVSRTLFEAMDIAIIALGDEKFALEYYLDEVYNVNEFWYLNLAKDKGTKKIESILDTWNILDEEKKEFVNWRKSNINFFSNAAHVSIDCAVKAKFIPSLRFPSRVSMDSIGHISTEAPLHLATIIHQIWLFGTIVIKSMMSENPPKIYKTIRVGSNIESLGASYLVLQEIILRYADFLYSDAVNLETNESFLKDS